MHDQLAPLVGQRVDIAGAAEPEKAVDINASSPATEPRNDRAQATSGTNPSVSTSESSHVVVHDLRVTSVEALGEPCTAR